MRLSNLYESGLEMMPKDSVVLAVHPNYVIDAVQAASSKWSDEPEKYGPNRVTILKKYINRFKQFVKSKLGNSDIIITIKGEPYQLHNWHDAKTHWEKADIIKMGMEQEEVYQLYQDLMDFINRLNVYSNVHIVSERLAGDACKYGKFDNIFSGAKEILIIGGNFSGCLMNTVEAIAARNDDLPVKIIKELTFDDDNYFWSNNI